MLQIEQLRHRCGPATTLDVTKLDLSSGEMLALLGPNGAGKSSLLKLVSYEKHHHYNITLHGETLNRWPDRARARHVGVLRQASQLTFPFTSKEVVALGLTPLSVSRIAGQGIVRQAMERCNCAQFADRLYTTLSGGEQQRVQLSRVLVQVSQAEKPPLLLLDEPTSAQDLQQQHLILSLAKELCREEGYGVIAVLHDLNHALRYCDKVAVLENGKLVAHSSPQQALSKELINSVWQYDPGIARTAEGAALIY